MITEKAREAEYKRYRAKAYRQLLVAVAIVFWTIAIVLACSR